jgi:hypothetical protein
MSPGTIYEPRNHLTLFLLFCGPLRRRTPGPPPFLSMNTMPAVFKARRTAKSFWQPSWTSHCRLAARETASVASDTGMNSLSGRLGNGAKPKSR